jgi:uncharacterized membrane protein YfcA
MLFLGGIAAGSIGGFLGIGGGILVMPMLRFLVGLSPAQAAGTCIVAVFFTTLGGSYRHYKLGHVHLRSLVPVVISGAIATIVFSFAFVYLSTRERWLDLGMGVVFVLIATRMIAEGIPGLISKHEDHQGGNEVTGSLSRKAAIGAVAGALPGLLGIGTGVVLVPSFVYVLNAPVKVAIASSLTCFSVNAFISSALKLWQDFTDLSVALPICAGTLLGANVGAMLNRRTSCNVLKLVFGLVFSYVSLRFMLAFFEAKI